jgi:hypothetical protein
VDLPNPPSNLTNGLYTAIEPNGRVSFILARQGQPAGHVSLPPTEAAEIAVNALGGAYNAYEAGMKGVVPVTQRKTDSSPFVRITGIGVGPCPIEDHACLVIRVGAAEIGFALPRAKLVEFAQSLAASKGAEQS